MDEFGRDLRPSDRIAVEKGGRRQEKRKEGEEEEKRGEEEKGRAFEALVVPCDDYEEERGGNREEKRNGRREEGRGRRGEERGERERGEKEGHSESRPSQRSMNSYQHVDHPSCSLVLIGVPVSITEEVVR